MAIHAMKASGFHNNVIIYPCERQGNGTEYSFCASFIEIRMSTYINSGIDVRKNYKNSVFYKKNINIAQNI